MQEFYIKIADIPIKIKGDNERIIRNLKKKYYYFLISNKPKSSFKIEIKQSKQMPTMPLVISTNYSCNKNEINFSSRIIPRDNIAEVNLKINKKSVLEVD